MQQVARQTKAARRAERGRARAAARHRREIRRRWLAAGVTAIVVAVGFGTWLVTRDAATARQSRAPVAVPADPSDVSTTGIPQTAPLAVGERIPSFTAPSLTGGTVDSSRYAGRPAVVVVWAPWCPHCQAELPVVADVMDEYPSVGFVTITTAVGANPGPTPEGYLREHGLRFTTAVDDARGTLAGAFGIRGFPTIYFVRADGTVANVTEGEIDAASLRTLVGSLG